MKNKRLKELNDQMLEALVKFIIDAVNLDNEDCTPLRAKALEAVPETAWAVLTMLGYEVNHSWIDPE